MKYKVEDRFEVTSDLGIYAYKNNAFVIHEIKKGQGGVVVSIEEDMYTIRTREDVIRIKPHVLENNSIPDKVSNKRYSKVIDTGLTYGQAMDQLLVRGKMVTRAVWDGYWAVQLLGNFNSNPSWNGRFIVAVLKDGGYSVASPYQDDMFANDWMVVE